VCYNVHIRIALGPISHTQYNTITKYIMKPTKWAYRIGYLIIVAKGLAGMLVAMLCFTLASRSRDTNNKENVTENDLHVVSSIGAIGSTETDFVIYVIDSGVRSTHQSVRGRVVPGKSFLYQGHNDHRPLIADQLGHGTAVASIASGLTNPEDIGIVFVPLTVVYSDGRGSSADVLSAVRYAAEHRSRLYPNTKGIILICLSEINHEVGYLKRMFMVDFLLEATNFADKNDFVTILAAGNSNQNPCSQSQPFPLSSLIVAATSFQHQRASYSNFGKCISLFASGFSVAASAKDDTSSDTIAGTSIAAARVTYELMKFWKQFSQPFSSGQVSQMFLRNITQEYVQDMRCELVEDKLSCYETPKRGI
jgi:subtilisin family serine protease